MEGTGGRGGVERNGKGKREMGKERKGKGRERAETGERAKLGYLSRRSPS